MVDPYNQDSLPQDRRGPIARANQGDCPPGERSHPTQDGWECRPDPQPQFPNSKPSDTCPDGQTAVILAGGQMECKPKCPPGQDHDANGNCFDNPVNPPSNNGGGGGSSSTYKPPPYKPTKSPYDAAVSKQLFDTLMNMINGGDAPFGPDTIAKLQAAALQSNKGQLANDQRDLQKRLINSGLSRSGVAPSSFQKLDSASSADLSNQFRNVAVTAVQQNYNARVTALNQAQQFLQSERANSLSQDQLILSYARLNQEWNTLQAGFDQQWKIVQNGDQQEITKLLLCLRTGVC